MGKAAAPPGGADQAKLQALQNLRAGRLAQAEAFFRQALQVEPGRADILYPLGLLAHQAGQLGQAEALYRQVLAVEPDHPDALHMLGTLLHQAGRSEEALECISRAIRGNPAHPTYFFNLGTLFEALGRPGEAIDAYRKALALDPDQVEALNNLGNILNDRGKRDEARALYEKAVALKPDYAQAYVNLAALYQDLGMLDAARGGFRRGLDLAPGPPPARCDFLHLLQKVCDWSDLDAQVAAIRDVVRDAPVLHENRIAPFSFLALPGVTAKEQQRCAERWAQVKYQSLGSVRKRLGFDFRREPNARIRLGYLSGDFFEHPTARLMVEMFELHDRGRFEIAAYSCGPDDGSPLRQRVKQAFDHFVDVADETDEQVARRIHADRIDILVDLMGYTRGTRSAIMALRPAPVQVSYLVYPGTMGADFIDYLIADRFVVPPEDLGCYTEKVAWLPDCYQPNDRTRARPAAPARAALGLPQAGVVFCCFNQTYKITPQVFDVWCRLLRAVPGSVLWLLASNAEAKRNLRLEAVRRGLEPERLIMAPFVPAEEHLARLQCADLCLDTLPYNAHTTCSDALWMGLPVITCVGKTFASRVAGSLLTAMGVPELITHTPDDYFALALELATDGEKREAIRDKIAALRDSAPLFDSVRFTRNIEAAYESMHGEYGGSMPAGQPGNGIVGETPVKHYIFSLSTGRSGTNYLADLLELNLPRSRVHHEQLGYANWGVDSPDVSHLTTFNNVGNSELVRAFWQRKFGRIKALDLRYFAETSHVLAKAGLVENLDLLQGSGKVHLIYLKRDILKTVSSLVTRADFLNKGNMWLWYLDPDYPNIIVSPEPFRRFGQIGFAFWYVIEMRTRAEYYRLLLAGCDAVVFHEADLEAVSRRDGAAKLLAELGVDLLPAEIELPGRVNANTGERLDDARRQQIREVVGSLTFDEAALARSWYEQGYRLSGLHEKP
ncbi:MAG: tetratricopeptide repeat protein [Limisphaerales bacterium]